MNPKLKYNVNETTRTVTCIATDCKYDALNLLHNHMISNGIFNISAPGAKEAILMPSTINATIKLEESDDMNDFDTIERYKIIARRSLKQKYHTMRLTAINRTYNWLMNRLMPAVNSATSVDAKIMNKHKFNWLTEEEYNEKYKKN